jgi:hypothetical protein
VRASGGSTAFYLLRFVVTEVRRLESNTGMGFRGSPGSLRSGGCEIASRNKEVQIPRWWHRRCCRAPQNHRPDQLGSRSALATPWARLVSDWGHQGLCLSVLVLGAHFGHILAHILHAGWRAGHHGANFRSSDLVGARVHSQWQYLTGFGR